MFDRIRDLTVEESIREGMIIDRNSHLAEHHNC